MKSPILVVMAAGMGSRYGGLKQMDPMDSEGNVIMDYSLFDAYRAGFREVVFIIKEENLEVFKEVIGINAAKHFKVHYAFQKMDDIPEGFSVPKNRVKPWGTAHALYSAREYINGPFIAINADDYYGVNAYMQLYDFLSKKEEGSKPSYAMVGYQLKNTVSDKGHVARGVCEAKDGKLTSIVERTRIEIREDGNIAYTEDDGKSYEVLDKDTIVSMNMWGFTKDFIDIIREEFPAFLEKNLPVNPEKCEFFVPFVVGDLLDSARCEVSVLTSVDKWYGVTYKEDKPIVMQAFSDMKDAGIYPKLLREDSAWQ